MSHFIISGAQGGATQGAVAPNRREINDLIKDTDQFSLYVQALSKPLCKFSNNPTGSLTPKQMRCSVPLKAIHFLNLVLAEYTVSLTFSGRVPVAPAPFKDPSGVDIAPTETCFSRLGTGRMWLCTRFVPDYKVLLLPPQYLIELYSKCCSNTPLISLNNTRINSGGQVQHRTSERLTGIGQRIPSRLPRSSLCRPSTSPRLTVTRPLCRTPCTSTPSTPSTTLSQLPTSIGRQRSDIRTTPTAQTQPLMPRP
jgi:hypothetical protein